MSRKDSTDTADTRSEADSYEDRRDETPSPILATGSLLLGTGGEGSLRWAITDLTPVLEVARNRLDLGPVSSAALGRTMAGSVLLLRMALKTPSRLLLEIRGDGPIGQVLAEADADGNVRGTVGDPRVDVPSRPDGKLNVGAAVGSGMLRVLREQEGEHGAGQDGRRYHSQVELVSGEIGEDLAYYLVQSEQTRSAVSLGVLAKPHGIAAAGGLIIELLPDAGEEVVARLETNLAGIGGISHLLEELSLEDALGRLLAGLPYEVLEQRPIHYRCRCSRERLLAHLRALAEREDDLAPESGEDLTAECAFCGEIYRFAPEEIGAG